MRRVKFFPNPFKCVINRIDVWLGVCEHDELENLRPYNDESEPDVTVLREKHLIR